MTTLFSHLRGNVTAVASGTSGTVTLSGAPKTGSLVIVGVQVNTTNITGLSVKDSNNNVYTITPNSQGQAWIAYLLSAPANATATINLTWTTTTSLDVWSDEFLCSGPCLFDQDAYSAGGPASTINTPSITPQNGNSLLYACATSKSNITAPVARAILGVWTGAAGAITAGNMSEYVLSATSATAVQFTQDSSVGWECIEAAFYINPHSPAASNRWHRFV